jgi:1-carboxybiuret hydrolase
VGVHLPGSQDTDLGVVAASDIARDVVTGVTTAHAVVTSALERAEAAEPLNAFTRLNADVALQRARRVDAMVSAGESPGPLAGVPIALKDLIDQEGIVTTAGSSFLDQPAASDAAVVQRLEAAGAVIIGRTGLHEFAYGFSSENDWWGPVRNPWDPATSPGGSSGGSAAAVAAGVVPLGVGTDTGGSVRVPASLCGLVGLKVTHGRIPLSGVFPLAPSLDTVGPLAQTVSDAAVGYFAMAGFEASDRWSVDQPIGRIEHVDLGAVRVAIPHPWVDRPLAAEQQSGFETVIDTLMQLGATVTHLTDDMFDATAVSGGGYSEVADVHRGWFGADPHRYGPAIRERLADVFTLTDVEIEAAATWRRDLQRAFTNAFATFDLIITPGTAIRSKHIGIDRIDVGAGPEPYRPAMSWFTPMVNQAGLPALVLPVEAPNVGGLPPSVQLIGPLWSEGFLLGVGQALDAADVVAHRHPMQWVR